jgi:hypothetical protein
MTSADSSSPLVSSQPFIYIIGDVRERNQGSDREEEEGTKTSTRAWTNHPGGYPMLAERIAVKPQTGIYRRFDALNARHILYLQAELSILENSLRRIEREDQTKEKGRLRYAVDYQRMLETPNDEDKTQLELIMKMHEKLRQYSKLR